MIIIDGWVKVHRKTLENPSICRDAETLAIWMYLLLSATHKEHPALFGGKKITLQPGQLVTGRKKIAGFLGVSESKVQRTLKRFENEQQIEQQSSNASRLITIVSWDRYQSSEQQTEQPMNSQRTASEQPVNTKQECKNERMKERKEYSAFFEQIWKLYPNKKGKGQVSEASKRRLLDIGYEQLERAIDRYKADLDKDKTWRKPQNGSTFFNSGYVDYLDENYAGEEERRGQSGTEAKQDNTGIVQQAIDAGISGDFEGF